VGGLQSQGVQRSPDITPSHVRAYLSELAVSHSPGGVHAHFRAVRAFLRWLTREGALAADPTRNVRPPRVDLEPLEPVGIEAVKRMLGTCGQDEVGLRDRSLLLALLDTGMRAGEVTAADVGDLDLAEGTLLVRRSKSRRYRVVFLGRKTRRALAAYLRKRGEPGPGEPLWCTLSQRKRLAYTALRDILRRRAKAADIAPPTLHSFRRAAALLMLRNGADPVSVSRILGHGSLAVTLRYLKQEQADLAQVHAQAGAVDRLL
jgi:site-specific recombinase XerD